MSTDLRDLHPDRPIRWPVRLTPHHRAIIYRLVDAGLLRPYWTSVADGLLLDNWEDAYDLYADTSWLPGVADGDSPEHDLYVLLAEIAATEARNGPAGQLPWRAP